MKASATDSKTDAGSAASQVCYELPLNERMRTYLRLEFLFERLHHHVADDSSYGRRAAIAGLLDILLLLGRSDIKGDLTKALGDQRRRLLAFKDRPGVDAARLKEALTEIDNAVSGMQGMSTQFAGAVLRDNSFLVSIANRSAIPGGTCGFDLPNLQHWLAQPAQRTRRDLESWIADLGPYERGVAQDLLLVRESVPAEQQVADAGMHVQTLDAPARMLRVFLPADSPVYPEISAGKRRFTVRFMEQTNVASRGRQSKKNLEFSIACCPQ